MAADRENLSVAEDTLARILADAVVEDLFAGLPDAPWIAVRCRDESEQKALADQLRAQGLEVILRSRTAFSGIEKTAPTGAELDQAATR